MPNWIAMAVSIVGKLPIERLLIKPRDNTKALDELASTLRASQSQNKPAVSVNPTPSTQEVAPALPKQKVATACVACAVGHFSTSVGLLNEAVRFEKEGINSNEIADRIAKILEEQNALERVDLTPEKIRSTLEWERKLAEEALQQSRGLRHRLETLTTIKELKEIAADTAGYYRRLHREWYHLRITQPGEARPGLTLKDAKKMAAEEAAKEVEAKWT